MRVDFILREPGPQTPCKWTLQCGIYMNITKVMISSFFNNNEELVDLFENMCREALAFDDYVVRANSLKLIGVAKTNQRFIFYIEKYGRNFKAKFVNDGVEIPFIAERKDYLLSEVLRSAKDNKNGSRVHGTRLNEAEYSLDYLKDSFINTKDVASRETVHKKDKSGNICLDYKDRIYVSEDTHITYPSCRLTAFFILRDRPSKYVVFSAYQNPDNGEYYISRDTFKKMKMIGLICVQVYDDRISHGSSTGKFIQYNDESVLKACGYTTAASADLSPSVRHGILDRVIENGLWSVSKVKSHLCWCIDSHAGPQWDINRKKWSSDLEYIRTKYK